MQYSTKQFHDQFVGKRLLNDVHNSGGEMILPSSTVLKAEHQALLEEHRIDLSAVEAVDVGPYGNLGVSEHERQIDEAVEHARKIFDAVRLSRVIPLVDIRKLIVPVIHHAVEQPNLLEILAALRDKDDYAYRHPIAVAIISAWIGKWLNLPKPELLQLITSAILHDVGKTQIPLEILNKPGELTPEEFKIMTNHTIIGYEMIKNTIGASHRQALAALQHHERMDGQGYPLGMQGSQTDLFSRIVAAADVFHAMASKRVYRNPSPFYEVLAQMERHAYGALDTAVVRVLIGKIMQNIVGYNALLTDGRTGKIVYINPQNPTLPLIHSGDQFIDLSVQTIIKIEQVIG